MRSLILVAALVSTNVFAINDQTTICTLGENQRKISIVYPQQTLVPCEVQYTKNGETQVLWNARAETGYCEEKASTFIEKQKGWGWSCEAENNNEPKKSKPKDIDTDAVSMIAD